MDWNEDGRKDLITGEYTGWLRIYLNTGTDSNPVFSGYIDVVVDEAPFRVDFKSTPFVIDWNNDGKKDLLCGEDSGKVWLLLNVGTHAQPVFDEAVYLQSKGSNIDVGLRSSPAAADWNRDGKKDLLVGEMNGTVYYFENTGTDASPVFDGSSLLHAGGSVIDVNLYSRLDVADWNNDGVLDLLCGNFEYGAIPDGGVYFFSAVGPLSAEPVNFIAENVGGSIDFHLDAGVANSGRNYLVLGTVSGTSPGETLPGGYATMPLNFDAFTYYVVFPMLNTSLFANFLGTLDVNGEASAQLTVPPVPGYAGMSLHFAYCLNNLFDYVSNAVEIGIIP